MAEEQVKNEIPENAGEKQETRDEKGRFVSGVSGNPAGKPAGLKNKPKLIDEIEEMLEEVAEGKDYKYRKAFLKKILHKLIIDGDTTLIKEYWQQKDGRPVQPTDLTSGGQPFTMQIINYDGKNNNNSIPVSAAQLSATYPASTTEIQDSSNSQEGGQKQDSLKPADNQEPAQ